MLSQSAWRRSATVVLVAVALFFLYFFGLTRTGMLGPDEPRYAAIGQAMADSSDWVTPRLWSEPWFEKPALIYWMTAVGFKAGLDEDLAPRLPVAIVSAAFLIYFFLALRKEFGEPAAIYATTILGTSAGWLAYSHIAVPDLPLSAASGAAMLLAMREDESRRTRNSIVAGILLGVSILAKALVPLALFVPALWFLRHRIRDLVLIFAAASVVAVPWYALAFARNGMPFLAELFWKHHFLRVFSAELQHERPVWFYIPTFAAALFPWTPLLLLLFSKRIFQDPRARFLFAWFAFGFVLFSLTRNKLPGYILPLMPPVAALIGIAMAPLVGQAFRPAVGLLPGIPATEHNSHTVFNRPSPRLAWYLIPCAALLWLIPAIQEMLPQALLGGLSSGEVAIPVVWIIPALAIVAACGFFAWKRRPMVAVALIALVMTLAVARAVLQVYPMLDQTISARPRWRNDLKSDVCLEDLSRSLHYGINYYARRYVPDCD